MKDEWMEQWGDWYRGLSDEERKDIDRLRFLNREIAKFAPNINEDMQAYVNTLCSERDAIRAKYSD